MLKSGIYNSNTYTFIIYIKCISAKFLNIIFKYVKINYNSIIIILLLK